MSEYFDTAPPAPIERLARIEGQSNFLSLLAGVEAGPDTTQDMAALSFARSRGAIPEVLEAYVTQADRFRLPLMTMVFREIRDELRIPAKDYPWAQGAVADAFLLMQKARCKSLKTRARKFKVDEQAYAAVRKVALGVLLAYLDRAEREWTRARFANAPTHQV